MQPHCWKLLSLCYITLIELRKSQIEEVLQVLDEELPGVSQLRPLYHFQAPPPRPFMPQAAPERLATSGC